MSSQVKIPAEGEQPKEENLPLKDKPVDGCNATKEGLLDPAKTPRLFEDSWCPLCKRRGFHCEVGNHPTREQPQAVNWTPNAKAIRILGEDKYKANHSSAIIVGPKCVISCAHALAIYDDPNAKTRKDKRMNKGVHEQYWIATEVQRDVDGSYIYSNKIKIELVKFNQMNDWAVFRRIDGKEFEASEIVEINIDTSVANDNFVEARAQIIHFPLAITVSSRPNEPFRVRRGLIDIQGQTANHVYYEIKMTGGSSGGGIFIYPSLKVIGMHQESIYEYSEEEEEGGEEEGDEFQMISEKRADSDNGLAVEFTTDYRDTHKKQKICESESRKSTGNNGEGCAIILCNCVRLIYYVSEVNKGTLDVEECENKIDSG